MSLGNVFCICDLVYLGGPDAILLLTQLSTIEYKGFALMNCIVEKGERYIYIFTHTYIYIYSYTTPEKGVRNYVLKRFNSFHNTNDIYSLERDFSCFKYVFMCNTNKASFFPYLNILN